MLTSLDVTIVVCYFAVTVGVGLWFARKTRGTTEFFLAGRKLVWPVIGLSLFATNISTEHLVGLAQEGHQTGLVIGGYEWMASYCLIMLAAVFAPQYLRHRVFTIPEWFEKRYGPETRVALTVYFLAMIVLTKTAVAAYAGGIVLEEITGWDLYTIMWGIGIITAAYTLFGGLAAVVYTDALQSVVLIGGSCLMTVLALNEVGGWNELKTSLAELGKSSHLSMVRGASDPSLPFTGFLLGNFLIGGMFYWCMDQVNVQRVLGARDVTHARKGAIFAGFLKITPVFILVLPGVIAVALPEINSKIDSNGKNTYTVLINQLLGPGLSGLVLAALLAALMSSMSSAFNSAATLVSRDLVARFRPDVSTQVQIRIGQIALLTVMASGIATAPVVGSFPTIWAYLQEVTGYLSVPFAVAGLTGIFTRWSNRRGAIAGILVGVIAGALFMVDSRLLHWFTHPLFASFLHRIFVAAVFSFAALWTVSKLTGPPHEDVLQGNMSFRFGPGPDELPPKTLLHDYRLWLAILFVTVTALWYIFR